MGDHEGWIRGLGLEPLEREGGWFRRVGEGALWPGGRPAWTSIVALFTRECFSALHRLGADEIWCYQSGDPLEVIQVDASGATSIVRLGLDLASGEQLQVTIPAGVWQAARPAGRQGWSLANCICVPGFSWGQFELGDRAALTAAYPHAAGHIRDFTRAVC